MPNNLPCPSCGNEDVHEYIPPIDGVEFLAVICRKCGMRGPIEAWNRRVPSVEVKGPVAINVCTKPPGPTWDVHNEALSRIVILRRSLEEILSHSTSRNVIVQRCVNKCRDVLRATEPQGHEE